MPHEIEYPFFFATEQPTTFADAPIGVAEPPMSVPSARHHASIGSGVPRVTARLLITGIIVAANGILPTNADAIPETQIIVAVTRLTIRNSQEKVFKTEMF